MNIHDNVKIVVVLLINLTSNVQPIYAFTSPLIVPLYIPRPEGVYKKRATEINHILDPARVSGLTKNSD
jgi:hypothetical protein